MHTLLITFLLFHMQGYETQSYKIIQSFNKIELRYYPSPMKVKVNSRASGNRNFKALFQYISGNNSEAKKIAMTTPVYMKNSSETQTMEFVLPAHYTDHAPKPKGKGVSVYQSKPGYYAAIRYGGYSNSAKETRYKKQLMDALILNGIDTIGEPMLLSYDAPYKFYNRKNEIMIQVKKESYSDTK